MVSDDPVYTSIKVIPIDSQENGSCSRCGVMVLDYARHTLFHRELDELIDVVRAWGTTLSGIPMPKDPPLTPGDMGRALGA